MAFNDTDIYTSFGSVQLFNEWTPYVSKFDTSSFYNWEQDNLPLYDLEERTFMLWEQAGFSTSAGITGLSLSVSADAPVEVTEADRTVFTDVSSCIAAIPKVVRFPVTVEVGSIGDLGALELHNFRIEEGGSIEIINRAHAKAQAQQTAVSEVEETTDGNMDANNSSHDLIRKVDSSDLSSVLGDTKLVHLNQPVLSATLDSRIAENVINGFLYPVHTQVLAPATVAIKSTGLITGDANRFLSTPFEVTNNTAQDATLGTSDVSAVNQSTDALMYRSQVGLNTPVGGCFYLNSLTKLSIKNCDGPIFVRNFFVDSEYGSEVGIEITNSDVVLENCASVRAKQAGFKFNNSRVVLSRSAMAYRNYELLNPTTRGDGGAGFHVVNSEVTLSGNPIATSTGLGDSLAVNADQAFISSRNARGWLLDNSTLKGGLSRSTATASEENSLLSCELNTKAGMEVSNSKVDVGGLVDLYGNLVGIDAWNSTIRYEYLCAHNHQNEAIKGKSSSFVLDTQVSPEDAGQQDKAQLDLSGNGQHVVMKTNSSFGFELYDDMPSSYGNSRFFESHGVQSWDGQVRASLPSILAEGGSSVDLLHAYVKQLDPTLTQPDQPMYGRVCRAQNGSIVSAFGSSRGATVVLGPGAYNKQRMVSGFAAQDNSTLNFHGPTAMGHFGVDILAENNSTINIEPSKTNGELDVDSWNLGDVANHTAVELHSTRSCIVVDNNSTLNCQDLGSYPANWVRGTGGQEYLSQGVDYDTETYATSGFTTHGCLQLWPNPQEATTISNQYLDNLTNGAGLNLSVSTFPRFSTLTGLLRFFVTQEVFEVGSSYPYSAEDNLSWGGMCVRAVGDSVVNMNNVHFPIGGNQSPFDGKYYTTDIDECHRFGIFNIADTSRMQASYLSVSGLHPVDSQYHGPSSLWVSSDGLGGDSPSYGAPEYTPDTGRLSILDAFGAGSGVWSTDAGNSVNQGGRWFPPTDITDPNAPDLLSAGVTTSSTVDFYNWGAPENISNNRGPFRLYFTPHSSARLLQTDASGYDTGKYNGSYEFSGVVGPAYQLLSQVYSLSSDCSSLVPEGEVNASGLAPNLLKLVYDSDNIEGSDQLWTSGYYYVNEFLDDNPTQVVVDESAADVFANAKNASIGMANRPKKVTIYRSRLDGDANRASESYTGDAENATLGFKSAGVFDLKRDN